MDNQLEMLCRGNIFHRHMVFLQKTQRKGSIKNESKWSLSLVLQGAIWPFNSKIEETISNEKELGRESVVTRRAEESGDPMVEIVAFRASRAVGLWVGAQLRHLLLYSFAGSRHRSRGRPRPPSAADASATARRGSTYPKHLTEQDTGIERCKPATR